MPRGNLLPRFLGSHRLAKTHMFVGWAAPQPEVLCSPACRSSRAHSRRQWLPRCSCRFRTPLAPTHWSSNVPALTQTTSSKPNPTCSWALSTRPVPHMATASARLRGTFEIVDNGFVSSINNSVGAAWGSTGALRQGRQRNCRNPGHRVETCAFFDDDNEIDYFTSQLVLQWNFWLSETGPY